MMSNCIQHKLYVRDYLSMYLSQTTLVKGHLVPVTRNMWYYYIAEALSNPDVVNKLNRDAIDYEKNSDLVTQQVNTIMTPLINKLKEKDEEIEVLKFQHEDIRERRDDLEQYPPMLMTSMCAKNNESAPTTHAHSQAWGHKQLSSRWCYREIRPSHLGDILELSDPQ